MIGAGFFFQLVVRLNHRIDNSLEKGWLSPPIEYYTAPEKLLPERALSLEQVANKLKKRYYIETKEKTSKLKPGYFRSQDRENCPQLHIPSKYCLSWRDMNTGDPYTVHFLEGKILALQKNSKLVDLIQLEPFLFAQYEKEEPILRKFKPLSEFPFYCLQAVLNAEDHQFIRHEGISLRAIMRAMWRNLRARRLAEGGSTITQQLVKNIFFSTEKSFRRKFQEQIMALLLETKLTKDKILSAYLNVVYMGQSGVFRVHGFGSAAEHYFRKPLSFLNLSECSFLAGLIQSPGRYQPSKDNTAILKRRNHIIETLYKKSIISKKESLQAKAQKISVNIKKATKIPVYFTDAVYREIKKQGWPLEEGLRVFTTLDLTRQHQAQQAISQGLNWLEKKRLKTELKKLELQAALINIDVSTGEVRAIQGGRDFKISQFNRVIQAQRQVGSLIKPAVVLASLIKKPSLHPLSEIKDQKFTHKYGLRSWSPKNYKEKYLGKVPLYKILTHSLNAGVARLGLEIGLDQIVKTIEKLSGPRGIKAHPSLTLGAIEMSPWEAAQMFLTLANMGQYKKQHMIKRVTSLRDDDIFYEHEDSYQKRLSDTKTAEVVGMLQEVCRSGTARWLREFPLPLAGKTGTTNEEKDAWFVGFTPETLTLVWVGFDDNRSLHLTGAGAALPIWEFFMRRALTSLSKRGFKWPRNTERREIMDLEKDSGTPIKVQLIFEK